MNIKRQGNKSNKERYNMFIFLKGNISDGFLAYGPYEDFDEAAGAHDNEEGWVMELGHLSNDVCDVEKMVTMTTLSDRDYWLQVGDCPKCRLGNTVHPQAGEFVCNKCNWKH